MLPGSFRFNGFGLSSTADFKSEGNWRNLENVAVPRNHFLVDSKRLGRLHSRAVLVLLSFPSCWRPIESRMTTEACRRMDRRACKVPSLAGPLQPSPYSGDEGESRAHTTQRASHMAAATSRVVEWPLRSGVRMPAAL